MKHWYIFLLIISCHKISETTTDVYIKSITIYREFKGKVVFSNVLDSLSPNIKGGTYVPHYREEFDSLGEINRLFTNQSEGFADESIEKVLKDSLFIKTKGIKLHISKAIIKKDSLFVNDDIYKIEFADWHKKRVICKLLKGENQFTDSLFFHEIYFR